jgi:hypothetical protein
MKLGYKTEKTQRIEILSEFFGLEPKTISNQINQETKLSNLQIKKAYWSISEGLPYYDMNELLRLLCIELSNSNLICRFTVCWSIDSDKLSQNLECVCNGKHYLTMMSGIEGINSILNQIGFKGDSQKLIGTSICEPLNYNNLLIWYYQV